MPQGIEKKPHIRYLTDGEKHLAAQLWKYSFADSDAFIDWYYRRRAGGTLAMLDGGDLVAQIVCVPVTLAARNAKRSAAILSGVATAPAHRRQGRMAALIRESLAVLRGEGVCAVALYPFNYAYYQRYGFAQCGDAAKVRVRLEYLPGQKPGGRIVPVQGGQEGYALLTAAYEASFSRYSGRVLRDESAFALLLEEQALDDGYAAVYIREGRPEGYILYSMREKTIAVSEIGAATHPARVDLLSFLGGHSSSMDTAEFTCPLEDPLWRLLPDCRGAVSAEPYDMLRIVDIENTMNGLPAGKGSVSLYVQDHDAPWNDGLWHFAARGGALTAEKSNSPAASPSDQGAAVQNGAPVLSIGDLSRWAFGAVDGGELRHSGADLPESCARGMDELLPKQPFFLYEMY